MVAKSETLSWLPEGIVFVPPQGVHIVRVLDAGRKNTVVITSIAVALGNGHLIIGGRHDIIGLVNNPVTGGAPSTAAIGDDIIR